MGGQILTQIILIKQIGGNNNAPQHCIYKMGEIVVNSRAVARFKFSRFDKFEARNRPHLHILPVVRKPDEHST